MLRRLRFGLVAALIALCAGAGVYLALQFGGGDAEPDTALRTDPAPAAARQPTSSPTPIRSAPIPESTPVPNLSPTPPTDPAATVVSLGPLPSPSQDPEPTSQPTATAQPTTAPPPHRTPTPAPMPPSIITPLDGGDKPARPISPYRGPNPVPAVDRRRPHRH